MASVRSTMSLMIPISSISPAMFSLIFCPSIKSSTCFLWWLEFLIKKQGYLPNSSRSAPLLTARGCPDLTMR